MRNPLQDQLLKAGLVKKSKLEHVNRERAKQRKDDPGQGDSASLAEDLRRQQQQRVERDRALAAEKQAQLQQAEQTQRLARIIEHHAVKPGGQSAYRFVADGAIRSLFVDALQRARLAAGTLVIASHDDTFVLLPREAGERVREINAAAIALDHGDSRTGSMAEDEAYKQFPVPDDLIW